ncbi:hypothetical protein IMCC21224_13173 [Puniceibacterium sp. IMCC21224]|nr:hypothetical protein IMCC21224_13173 [Puniceibacterium sp. IMCC21224]
MYSKIATSACRRVAHDRRQISSALMVLKNVSTAALKLLYSSSLDLGQFWDAKLAIDFADDVAFQATNNLAFALPVFGAFLDISQCRFMASHSDNGDTIERSIGLAIATPVQSEPMCSPT